MHRMTIRNAQHQLPFAVPPPIRWLPDETAYSLAARYALTAGLVRTSATSKLLFGRPHGGFPHSLPSGIGHLASVCGGALGAAREIAVNHTIAPQLVVARPAEVREATLSALEYGPTTTIKAKLGLLASRFGSSLPLKACGTCVAEDRRTRGYSYWRVTHQLPGVWLCAQHSELLSVSMAMRAGQARYSWILPAPDDLVASGASDRPASEEAKKHLARLAEVSHWLCTIGRRGCIDPACAAESLWKRLYEINLARPPHRLHAATASKSFCQFFDATRVIPELERIAVSPSAAYSQLLAVLRPPSNGLHPVRIASVIAWLFPTASAFVQAYVRSRDEPPPPATNAARPAHNPVNPNRAEFLKLLASGASISASARIVGVEVATGQAWAVATGIAITRRPSIVRGDRHQAVLEALKQGADKSDIASEFHLSLSSITRILRTEVGLRDAWSNARVDARRAAARAAWSQALSDVGYRVKLARSVIPAEYAWLYRNDRAWLERTGQVHNQIRSNHSAVDWAARDMQLSTEVLHAAEALYTAGQIPIRLLDLLARLPSLKRNLPNLDRLPRTEQELNRLLRRRRRRQTPELFPRSGTQPSPTDTSSQNTHPTDRG